MTKKKHKDPIETARQVPIWEQMVHEQQRHERAMERIRRESEVTLERGFRARIVPTGDTPVIEVYKPAKGIEPDQVYKVLTPAELGVLVRLARNAGLNTETQNDA